MQLLELTRSQLETFDWALYFKANKLGARGIQLLLQDLAPRLGTALVVNGLAVVHHGYERYTRDANLLYGNSDSEILHRLSGPFKLIKKSEGGNHCLQHAESEIKLQLIREGTPVQHGVIPGPHLLESDNGFVSLWGLILLKLLRGLALDDADICEVAKRRMTDVYNSRGKLPYDFHARFDKLITQAKFEMEHDPQNQYTDDIRLPHTHALSHK